MPDEQIFTKAQWEAARLLIVRLNSEANKEELRFEDIGMTWLDAPDPICAVADDGTQILSSELVYAAIVLLWSMILDQASELEVEPTEVIGQLGLGLARSEPA